VRLCSNNLACRGDQLVESLGESSVAVCRQEHLAGSNLCFHTGEVIRQAHALSTSILGLDPTTPDHERHLAVLDNGIQSTGMEFAAALTLRTSTVGPKASNDSSKSDPTTDQASSNLGTNGDRRYHLPRPRQEGQ
jgi:hypothetical protein